LGCDCCCGRYYTGLIVLADQFRPKCPLVGGRCPSIWEGSTGRAACFCDVLGVAWLRCVVQVIVREMSATLASSSGQRDRGGCEGPAHDVAGLSHVGHGETAHCRVCFMCMCACACPCVCVAVCACVLTNTPCSACVCDDLTPPPAVLQAPCGTLPFAWCTWLGTVHWPPTGQRRAALGSTTAPSGPLDWWAASSPPGCDGRGPRRRGARLRQAS
jgi:hypothetical protein